MNVYTKGNVELLKSKNLVSVSGSRKITEENSKWLKKAFEELPSDSVIVSGLALGTDTIAHQLALEFDLRTIAVLPTGFERITPKRNIPLAEKILEDDGLLISEYSPNTSLKDNNQYIDRNRIIAKIGKYLIMPQCDKYSGTMHTVNFVRKQHKPIILPNNSFSGNQFIINNDKYISVIF